jgi:UbiD family decarboxylase
MISFRVAAHGDSAGWLDEAIRIAIRMATGVPYGLASGVHTRDMVKALGAAREIRAGVVRIAGKVNRSTWSETVDLEVPATSEILIEGTLSNNEASLEGVMGEYPGYLFNGPGHYQPTVAGEPVEEDQTAWGIPAAAEVLAELRHTDIGFMACSRWRSVRTGVGERNESFLRSELKRKVKLRRTGYGGGNQVFRAAYAP